jgi:hypothetical protein
MGPREQTTEAARLAFDDVVAVLTAHPLIGTEHGNVACGAVSFGVGGPGAASAGPFERPRSHGERSAALGRVSGPERKLHRL